MIMIFFHVFQNDPNILSEIENVKLNILKMILKNPNAISEFFFVIVLRCMKNQ